LSGPILLLPRFAQGCIVTTNFDDAIEKTYEKDAGKFEAYMHGTQDHNFFQRLVRGDRCLLKLHGDAENFATHILTKAQYEEAYGEPFDFHKPLPKALRQIYISQSLLFLGCSLDQDWTLELFKKAKEEDAYQIPNHYAILPAPTDEQVRQQKTSTLLALNIHPFWYPDGQHDYVEKLLQLVVAVTEKRVAYNG
ncbi:MAG: SIR2 family protein, partial [Gallionellaceae bacterium]|nr:SIR2 family protein [Gallionellaceae bacterium]